MATSRTGTSRWLQIAARRRRQAQRDGIDNCPECGVILDYKRGSKNRNAVHVDHILSVAMGGTDTYENTRVTCARCNQSLGAKRPKAKRARPKRASLTLETSREW